MTDKGGSKNTDSPPKKTERRSQRVEETTVQAKGGGEVRTFIRKTRRKGRSKLATVQPETDTQVAVDQPQEATDTSENTQPEDAVVKSGTQLAPAINSEQLAQAEMTRRAVQQQQTQTAEKPASSKARQQKKEDRKHSSPAKAKQEKGREKAKDDESSDFTRKQKLQRSGREGKLSRNASYIAGDDHRRRRRKPKPQAKLKRNVEMQDSGLFEKPEAFVSREIEVPRLISVGDLARLMSIKAGDLIPILFKMGVMKTINEVLDQDTAALAVEEVGHKARLLVEETVEEKHEAEQLLGVEGDEPRAPIVTVMGHVDHGKTSLLDYIRKTQVASGEAGGITQHIGAYHVNTGLGGITFLDTPGHADFTAMRARGAQLTDIVILMVAADDGVMPQTIEAIQHARAAEVPIVVAISKIDLEKTDVERIKADLAAQELVPEEWGGQAQLVPVSTVTGEGIEDLLEAITLQAELLELKATTDAPARGRVIESRLDKGGGPVASLLITNGKLSVGDVAVAGEVFGRVRAMINEHGQRIKEAGPAMPVEVLGFGSIPEVGDAFAVVVDDKKAKELVAFRRRQSSDRQSAGQQATRLEDIFNQQGETDKTLLNLIVKADVQGSLEAIEQAVSKLNNDEVQASIIGKGVGGITESEALFARTSNAILLGFNVRADATAKKVIESFELNLRYYSVIYELVDDLKVLLSGMMAPELREQIVGTAEVRDIFNSQRYGLIAGCMVTQGSVWRNKKVRVLRDNVVIYEGELESLRRVKEDVDEVRSGIECGIGIRNYRDVCVGDVIETFDVQEVARAL